MKKSILLLFFLISLSIIVKGQCGGTVLTVNNPSFEGTPQPHITPPGWDICLPGVTPDTQPGSWGVTLPPSNGSSYLGLVYQESTGWEEGAGQTLSSPMIAGTTYNFTIDLAVPGSADPSTGLVLPPYCEQLQLWGGMSGVNSGCDMSELLWTSPIITNTSWVTYPISFTPTQNWDHILFLIYAAPPACTDGQYILVDNMTPVIPVSDVANYVWTSTNFNSDICAGQVVNFQDSSTSISGTINSWTWHFGDGTSSTQQNPSHVYTTPGTYLDTLTVTSTIPCTTSVVNPVVVYGIPSVVVGGGGSLCAGGSASVPVTFTFTGVPPWSLTYTDGVTPVTVNGITTSPYTVNATASGVYTATAFSDVHCDGTISGSAIVNISASLTLTATASPPAVCLGSSSTILAAGATTYSWMPGSLSGTSNTVTPAATTTYTVTGTAGICTGSVTVSVTVNPIPVVTSTATPAIICNGASSTLAANSSVAGTSYAWMPGSLTGTQTTVSPANTTTYTVTGTATGCTGSSTVMLTVNPNPVVTSAATPSAVCNGDTSSLTANSNIAGTTFVWVPGSLTGTPVTVTPAITTTYTVTGTASGCTGSSFVTINVSNNPVISISAVPGHICPGDTCTLTCIGAAQTYSWSPTISISNPLAQSTQAYPASTTIYTVTASNNGCSSTANYNLVVSPVPTVDFTSDKQEGCQGLLIHFQDLTTPTAVQWLWNFGDTHITYGNSSAAQNPYHYYAGVGSYDVSLSVVSVDGCKAELTYPGFIITHAIPVANFAVNPDVVNQLDALVFFTDQSVGASVWNWNFGELNVLGNLSTLENPTHVYSDTGTFYPSLIVFSEYGCTDTAVRTVIVEPNVAFYIPNAFTPNDDGKNQYFAPKGEGINTESFAMYIYDRWGRLVFSTNKMEPGWDGSDKNGSAAEGGYIYMISFCDVLGKEHSIKGNLTLIR